MDIEQQGETFAKFIAAELKGQITARGSSALYVANATGHAPATINRWLNGRREIPISFVYKTCKLIGIDVTKIISLAEERLSATSLEVTPARDDLPLESLSKEETAELLQQNQHALAADNRDGRDDEQIADTHA